MAAHLLAMASTSSNMSPILEIAVISDTHNEVPALLMECLRAADEIWHLGDVSSQKALFQIESLNIETKVVQGNTDPIGQWPATLELKRHGVHFQLQHYPATGSGNADVILHGHLHRPIDETTVSNIRILSPGAISGPRAGSKRGFGWLRFYGERNWSWERETF